MSAGETTPAEVHPNTTTIGVVVGIYYRNYQVSRSPLFRPPRHSHTPQCIIVYQRVVPVSEIGAVDRWTPANVQDFPVNDPVFRSCLVNGYEYLRLADQHAVWAQQIHSFVDIRTINVAGCTTLPLYPGMKFCRDDIWLTSVKHAGKDIYSRHTVRIPPPSPSRTALIPC